MEIETETDTTPSLGIGLETATLVETKPNCNGYTEGKALCNKTEKQTAGDALFRSGGRFAPET